ncbi:hypothetical protein Acr_00g0089980 [Actinidia rufa]|uniref:Uncharacterized protein n=1 Tax=Actinidia rufa TaxID=165716 RepID=A0A7J0DWS4_9ERIC|nr:hypothetical protein Acr_00g0089980 [Actinidia rufa]
MGKGVGNSVAPLGLVGSQNLLGLGLPQDMGDLAAKGLEEFRDKRIMQGIQSLQRAVANSECLKKYSTDLKKANQKAHTFDNEIKLAKINLVAAEHVVVHAPDEAEAALEQMNMLYKTWLSFIRWLSARLAYLPKRVWNSFGSSYLECGSPIRGEGEGIVGAKGEGVNKGNLLEE